MMLVRLRICTVFRAYLFFVESFKCEALKLTFRFALSLRTQPFFLLLFPLLGVCVGHHGLSSAQFTKIAVNEYLVYS